jgi:D-tyrosyl-tRNA(Tyr) deacylase
MASRSAVMTTGKVRTGLLRQRSHRVAAGTGGYDISTVQDEILGAMEKLFGNQLPEKSFESLTDNGSAYVVHETSRCATEY